MYFTVRRGENKGTRLRPHLFRDRTYHVLRKKGDVPTPVKNESDLESWVERGYCVRMSNKEEKHSPNLIAPGSIEGRKKAV
jgi:hypothetical protein